MRAGSQENSPPVFPPFFSFFSFLTDSSRRTDGFLHVLENPRERARVPLLPPGKFRSDFSPVSVVRLSPLFHPAGHNAKIARRPAPLSCIDGYKLAKLKNAAFQCLYYPCTRVAHVHVGDMCTYARTNRYPHTDRSKGYEERERERERETDGGTRAQRTVDRYSSEPFVPARSLARATSGYRER